MPNSSERPPLFERLQAGLEEGIRFARGELKLQATLLPSRPPTLDPQDVVRLRRQLKMSQGVFARMLNVSPKTVQGWEQGDRRPSQAALRLLQIVQARPQIVCEIVGFRSASKE